MNDKRLKRDLQLNTYTIELFASRRQLDLHICLYVITLYRYIVEGPLSPTEVITEDT